MKAQEFLRSEAPPPPPRDARAFLRGADPAPPRQSAAAFLRGEAPPVQAVPPNVVTPPTTDPLPAAPTAPPPPPARATAASTRGVQPDLSLSVRPPVLIPPGEPIRRDGLTPLPPLPGAPAPAAIAQPATPQLLSDLLPTPTPPAALVPPDQPRLPEAVLADIQAGREGMTARELADLLAAFERPETLADPAAARQLLALRLQPEQLQAVDDALRVREILAGLPDDSAMIPGGPATETFLGGLVRGATLNMVEPEQPTGAPGTEIERLLRQSGRAQDIAAGERRAEHPIADLGGEAAGSILPFAAGVQLLRGLRAARGLAPVEQTTAGVVKEGAIVGGPQAFAYRPEGADDMSAEQELTARAIQSGVGLVAGAVLDFSVMKVGDWFGRARTALADRRLAKEAEAKGFASPEEYLASLVQFERTPDGVVVRPRPEALRALPGETDPLPVDPNNPPSEAGNVVEPAGSPGTERGATEGAAPGGPLELPAPTPEPAPDRTPAMRRQQADEYDRLARATTDPAIRQELLRQAQTLRAEAQGEAPKLTPQERAVRARRIDTERDDIITAIRKLGGLDVARETDWAGRLSHLPRRGFGLPGIEQARGGGRTLDDLAEVLHEFGYLSRRDLTELEEKLARAETGEELFSLNRQNYDEPERPRPSSTDRDWTYGDVDDVRALDQDFVIDTDNGTVIPARPFDEDDWVRLLEEERNAARFFESEAGADVEPRGDGAPGVSARLADTLQGRDGVEPEPGGSFGLPGIESRSPVRQGLADLERAQDLRRNGTRDVAPDEGPGDLFSGRARQSDIDDFVGEPLPGETAGAGRSAGRGADTIADDGQLDLLTVSSVAQARAAVRELAQGREGVVLLDNKSRPVGFLPMSAADMAQLRQGVGGPAQRLLAALDETNASGFIAKINGNARTESAASRNAGMATENLAKFSRAHGARLLDVLDDANWSAVERNELPDNPGTEFYANPFVKAFAETASAAVRYPGRTGAEAFVGATAGGTTSDEEAGSPLWWLDVARGAALGVAFFQGARGAKLIGKGSIAARSYERLGAAIERLPFLGRGPAELREFKRKQRVMRALMDRQTEAVGRELLARFTPAERAMMADLIESRGIVQDFNIVHRQAQALDDFVADAAERMKALGMLPEDMETGGYLHRYYAKHLGIGDKLFRQAKNQTLSGSYTIARGTDGTFDRSYLSPAARRAADEMDALLADKIRLERELQAWERRADLAERGDDPDLFLEKYREAAERIGEELDEIRAQLQALRKTELVEYTGIQNGTMRSFLFARDEVPRVDPGLDPRHAQKDRPDVKPGDLAAQRLPEAPGVEQLTETGRIWRLRGSDRKGVLMHRDWTKAERQAWGEIEDAGYRYVRGMAEVSHDLSLATLYSTVARRGDWVKTLEGTSDVVIDGQKWVYVPDTKVNKGSPLRQYGQLAGQHVRADVWNGIRNYGRPAFAPGPLGTLYRQALSKWKLYKTVYNPVTHLNNTYSNFEMLYMGGYQARDVARALNTMRKGEADALWREARDAGLFGTDWTSSLINVDGGGSQAIADLAEQLRTQPEIPDAALSTSIFMDVKDWWINSRNAVRGAPTKLASGAEVARALAAPAIRGAKFINRPIKAAARGAQRLYRFEDEVFKLAVYQAERRAGKSPEEAIQIAERYFFDYNDLPEAVKWIRDLPVGAPFVSYTYFAIPAIARNIVERPERVLALAAAYEAWNFAALQATGDGLGPGEYWAVEADMEAISPPWERGRAIWGARNTVMLPSPEGYRLALGRSHALGNPFMSEAGGREKLPSVPYLSNFWGSSVFGSNPLHAVLDVMVNEDWKGKEIYQPGDTTDDKAAKVAAYLYQAWAPSNILTPGSYHQSRILEGLANDVRQAREAGEPDGLIAPVVDLANRASEALGFGQFTGLDRADNEIDTRDALLGSFGVKLRPLRLGQSADFEMDAIERELQIHDKVIRRAAREAGEGRRTDAQFEATRDKQFSEIDRLLDRRDEIAGAKQRLDERGILR